MENITFWKYTWNITFANYANWRIALIFWNEDWKISNLTVNFVEVSLEKNYWFLNANLPYANEVKSKLLELWIIEELWEFYKSWFLDYEKVKFLKWKETNRSENITEYTNGVFFSKEDLKNLYEWKKQTVGNLIANMSSWEK